MNEVWISTADGSLRTLHRVAGGYSLAPDQPPLWTSYDEAERYLSNEELDGIDGRRPWEHLELGDGVAWVEVWSDGSALRLLREVEGQFQVCSSYDDVVATHPSYDEAEAELEADGFALVVAPPVEFYDEGSQRRRFLAAQGVQ